MSDVSDKEAVQANPEDEKEQFVAKSAYQKVSQDMHKYKSEMKNLSSELAALRADQEARERAVLEENGKWQDLYKKAEHKLSQIQQERESERSQFVDSHKKNAVIQTLGGFKKPEYTKFIDTSKVDVLEDGSVDSNSVLSEVDRIRKEYPELIKQSPKQGLPDAAPRLGQQKSISQMTDYEKAALRKELLTKK